MPDTPVADAEGPDDLTLLRAFEPVVRFTRGEYFFPVSVERYVARATLWSDPESDAVHRVGPAGSLDLARLVERGAATQGLGESLSGIVSGEKPGPAVIPPADRPPRLRGRQPAGRGRACSPA